MAAVGDDAGLNGLASVLVHEDEGLVEKDFLLENEQATVLRDGVGGGLDGEFFTGEGFAVDAKRHGHDDACGAAALSSTSVAVTGHAGRVLDLCEPGECSFLFGEIIPCAGQEETGKFAGGLKWRRIHLPRAAGKRKSMVAHPRHT